MRSTAEWARFCLAAAASALGDRRLLNCVWELTYRCNARCAMCTYWKLPARAAGELDTAQVRTGLERVAAHGCGLVNFSGGEPTLRHDLEAIVAHASGLGMWTSIVTNGSVMTRDRLRRLKAAGLDSLLVSVDSADARVHDRGRGMPGSHAKAMECLRWVAEDFAVGHRIGAVMTVIPPVQPETVLGVVDLAERAGLSVLLQPYHERKTGRSNATAAVPEWLARALAARKRTSGCLLNSSAYLAALTSPAAAGCHAGRKYFSVDPVGGLHPCADMPPVGDVLSGSFDAISSPEATAAVGSCEGCWYCFRGEADLTLSAAGCVEKARLGVRVMARNARAQRQRTTGGSRRARPARVVDL